MKKKIFALIVAIIGAFAVTGCGAKKVYVVGETYKFNIEFKDSYITKSHEYDNAHYFYLNEDDDSPYLVLKSSKLISDYVTCYPLDKEKIGSYEGCLSNTNDKYIFVVPYTFKVKDKELGFGFKFVGKTKEDVEKLVKKTSKIKYIGLIEKTSRITKDWLYK